MNLDDLHGMGIVVGHIVDADLGNKFIACLGEVTRGGVRSKDGQYWMGDTQLEAAMRCYEASGITKEVRTAGG
jgi:hypothetical protein